MTALQAVSPTEPVERVVLQGPIDLQHGKQLWKQLQASLPPRGPRVQVDLSQVSAADGSGAALLSTYQNQLAERGVACEFVGVSPALREILHLYESSSKLRKRRKRKPQGSLDQIGTASLGILKEAQLVIAFFGQMVVGVMNGFRHPRSVNWKELLPTAERAGADALPIVALINFLVGMVIALQSAGQLHRFGADIFLADLVGISVLREIGPLMTAIIMTGRTGAAFAAELGSMKTNEEIDALRTMGFGPMRFLVLPRVLALMMIAPLLTVVADLAGGLGGLAVGMMRLDLSASAYFAETQRAVKLFDLISGLIKSSVFALAITLIACQQGLAATGGAEGVGRRTTGAVVTSLFSLIILDAVFTVFFEAVKAR
ncbi:MAG: MlaE family lipid ABC transporter permease subunit [Polyangiales bacterium]